MEDEEKITQMATTLSSSLLRFSHIDSHFLSHSVRFYSKPLLSPLRAAPPDSSPKSGESSAPPSSEKKNIDELNYDSKKNKKKRRKDRTVIRRDPIRVGVTSPREEKKEAEEQSAAEGAFLLAWLGLGALILVEGVALAASGENSFLFLVFFSACAYNFV